MKSLTLLFCVLFAGSAALAASPSTKPSGPSAIAGPTVLIAPFQQINGADNGGHAWIAKALQEDMISTVARFGAAQPKSLDHALGNTESIQAQRAGQVADASIVVYGSYQVIGDQIRIDGSIVTVADGKSIGSLQATGGTQNLFQIEDGLGRELNHAIQQGPDGALPAMTYGATEGGPNPYFSGADGQQNAVPTTKGLLPYADPATQTDTTPSTTYVFVGSAPTYSQPTYAPYDYSYANGGYPYRAYRDPYFGYPYNYCAYPYDYGYGAVYSYPYSYGYFGPAFLGGGFIGGGFNGHRRFNDHNTDDFRGGRFINGGSGGIAFNGGGFNGGVVGNFTRGGTFSAPSVMPRLGNVVPRLATIPRPSGFGTSFTGGNGFGPRLGGAGAFGIRGNGVGGQAFGGGGQAFGGGGRR